MLINDAGKRTSLTKKAIDYYVEQGLIAPAVLENGYRDFGEEDVERLNRISVLRRLGIGTEDIKRVFADQTGDILRSLSVQKELDLRREQSAKAILEELSGGRSYADVRPELETVEQTATITEKLLAAFPGCYGRFICLHFARFLNEPMRTDKQRAAYREIIGFLDSVPPLRIPGDLQDYFTACTGHLGSLQISELLDNVSRAYQNPDAFLSENRELLEGYMAYKQSDAYKDSPNCKMEALLRAFCGTSGYYDVFIPAMKVLSGAYARHCSQMEAANEKLLARYPELAGGQEARL